MPKKDSKFPEDKAAGLKYMQKDLEDKAKRYKKNRKAAEKVSYELGEHMEKSFNTIPEMFTFEKPSEIKDIIDDMNKAREDKDMDGYTEKLRELVNRSEYKEELMMPRETSKEFLEMKDNFSKHIEIVRGYLEGSYIDMSKKDATERLKKQCEDKGIEYKEEDLEKGLPDLVYEEDYKKCRELLNQSEMAFQKGDFDSAQEKINEANEIIKVKPKTV